MPQTDAADNACSDTDPSLHLFIAGAPRCGTTALFDRLAAHPEIAAACIKEPNFLMPRNFPMKGFRPVPYESGMGAYRALFEEDAPVRMEASATYLYAPEVARRIRDHFPNGKVVLIFREPVARLVSEFRMSAMLGVLPHDMDFRSYLQLQRASDTQEARPEPEMRALRNGLYSRHLAEYLQVLGHDRVHVLWTESLRRDPQAALSSLCRFVGINGTPPAHRDEGHSSNPSLEVGRPRLHRLALRWEAARTGRLARKGRRDRLVRATRRLVTRPLFQLSTRTARPVQLHPDDQAFLDDYYREEPARLQAVLGERPPW